MMKYMLLLGFFGLNANPVIIDLHSQRISSEDIEERVMNELIEKNCYKNQFALVLSDNFIDDSGIRKLMEMLARDNNRFGKNLIELDFSNNKLTIEGTKYFIPLLKQEQFGWLNLSINSIEVSKIREFFTVLWHESYDYRLRDEMARKIVWLPKGYDVDQFFKKDHPFFIAHKQYYELP